MDRYKERLVKGRSGRDVAGFMIGGIALITIGLLITVLVHQAGLFIIPVGVVLIVMAVQRMSVEFEYLILNGDIEIAKIISKKSRKTVWEITAGDVQYAAPADSDTVKNDMERKSNLEVYDYTAGEDATGTCYAFLEQKDSKERMSILDLDEECISLLKETLKSKFR